MGGVPRKVNEGHWKEKKGFSPMAVKIWGQALEKTPQSRAPYRAPRTPSSDDPEYINVPRLENYVPPETNHPPKTSLNKTALYTIAAAMLVQQLRFPAAMLFSSYA